MNLLIISAHNHVFATYHQLDAATNNFSETDVQSRESATRSFIRSLQAGVQSTLYPSAETI